MIVGILVLSSVLGDGLIKYFDWNVGPFLFMY